MKTPKGVKGKVLIKCLVKKGYEMKSRSGSHVTLSNGANHITIVLPVSSIGVLKQVSRITGIPISELLDSKKNPS